MTDRERLIEILKKPVFIKLISSISKTAKSLLKIQKASKLKIT